MDFGLPVTVEINGEEQKINTDYREILKICVALNDQGLSETEKVQVALILFYPELEKIQDYQEAINKLFWFIDMGEDLKDKPKLRLYDWEQDFQYIVAPINRVVGKEIRSIEYMHWWTFISAFYEIGDCLFSQIVRIRDCIARGKKLDKTDKEWLKQNGHLVRFKNTFSQAENDTIDAWTKGVNNG